MIHPCTVAHTFSIFHGCLRMHFKGICHFSYLHTYSFVNNNISRLHALVNTVKAWSKKFIYFYRVIVSQYHLRLIVRRSGAISFALDQPDQRRIVPDHLAHAGERMVLSRGVNHEPAEYRPCRRPAPDREEPPTELAQVEHAQRHHVVIDKNARPLRQNIALLAITASYAASGERSRSEWNPPERFARKASPFI